jgi:WD40 repeat protein
MSADGSLLATLAEPGDAVELWDPATGKPLRRIKVPGAGGRLGEGWVESVALSDDGALLLTLSMNLPVQLWDTATGKVLQTWTKDTGTRAASFSPEGKTIALCADQGKKGAVVTIRDTTADRVLNTFEVLPPKWARVALSPDGKTLAAWSDSPILGPDEDQAVQLVEVATGKELRRLKASPPVPTDAVAFAPDGKTLAAVCAGEAVRLWDVGSGKQRRLCEGKLGGFPFLAFAADGKTLAGCDHSGTASVWDATTGKCLGRFDGPPCRGDGLAFRKDGTAVAWGKEAGAVRVWEVRTGKLVGPREGHADRVVGAAITPDGKGVISVGRDGTACSWDVATAREGRRPGLRQVSGANGGTLAFEAYAVAAGGKFVAAASRAALAPGGKWAGRLVVWDAASGRPVCDVEGTTMGGGTLHLSGDGSRLATVGIDRTLRVWDTASGKELHAVETPAGEARSLALAPDGKTAAVGTHFHDDPNNDRFEVRVVELAGGKVRWQRRYDYGDAKALAFAPDGRTLAAHDDDSTVRLWDTATGEERRLKGADGARFGGPVAFSPDGRTLAVTRYNLEAWRFSVQLWEVATGTLRRELEGHAGPLSALAFAPDGRALATGSDDTTLLLWDLTTLPGEKPHRDRLTGEELNRLWSELADPDGAKALPALLRLAAAPTYAVPFLRKQVPPVEGKPFDADAVARWIAALDDADFDVREKATRDLEKVGGAARPALVKALEAKPGPEAKRRLEGLLARLDEAGVSASLLGPLRALEALELAGTPEARKLLGEIAAGRADAPLTREAKAAAERLSKLTAPGP